jgi:hypothetical protein
MMVTNLKKKEINIGRRTKIKTEIQSCQKL